MINNIQFISRISLMSIVLLATHTAYADISGKVFRDFNASGVQDNTATFSEPGIGGVTVSCTDASGGTGTTTTSTSAATLGTYTLAGCSGASRVEFTIPMPGDYSGAVGGDNNTSIQFVDGSQTGVNFAVSYPGDYCPVDPTVAVSTQFSGDGTGASATMDTLHSFPFSTSGSSSSSNITDMAKSELGSVWGLAYDKRGQRVFLASFLKRHVGLKDGLGYIYIGSQSGNNINYSSSFNLQGVTPSNGGAAIDLGSVCRDVACIPAGEPSTDYVIPADPSVPSIDLDAFGKVGKAGLGGLEITQDNQQLWAVNLYQRALIRLDATLGSAAFPGTVQQYLLDNMSGVPSCTGGVFRPFGLTFYRTKGYLGGVCDASVSKQVADLKAYVLSFDPNTPTAGFATVVSMNLNYNRGGDSVDTGNNARYYRQWHPWQDTWAGYGLANEFVVYNAVPMVSDIAFDTDGSITLVLMDRFSQQVGRNQRKASSRTGTNVDGRSKGGLIHFCKDSAGAFHLEGSAQCPVNFPHGVEGPSNNGRYFYDVGGDGGSDNSIGSIAYLPGTHEMVTTVYDPSPVSMAGQYDANSLFTQGLNWLDTVNGSRLDYFKITDSSTNGGFGKGSGLGELELLCPPASVEIGNRVWLDTDGDGIQDPSESGIAGVSVELRSSGGSLLATVTTAADGTYYFTNATGTDITGKKYGVTQLQPNTGYTLHFPTTTASYSLTSVKSGGNTLIDSDAAVATGDVVVATTDIPMAGANNHSFDVGYTAAPPPPSGCTTITNTAQVTGVNQTDTDNTNDSDSAAIQANCAVPSTDLKLLKTSSKSVVRHGEAVTYTLTLTNESTVDATNVQVTDNLPTGLTLVGSNPSQGTFSGGVWDVGTVTAGATVTLTIDVTVD